MLQRQSIARPTLYSPAGEFTSAQGGDSRNAVRRFRRRTGVLGDVELVSGPGQTAEDVIAVAAGADVILAGAAPRFDAGTLEELDCRAIVRLGVGVDGVDLETARSLGMWVANVPDYGTDAVALHAVTLVLASLRRLTTADRRLREGSWGVADLRPLSCLPSSLTAGSWDSGGSGAESPCSSPASGSRRVPRLDPAVEPTDVTHDARRSPGRLASVDELLGGSDVVTLHSPPPADGYLLGAAELRSMREGSILVNTARGSLVDTEALVVGTRRQPARLGRTRCVRARATRRDRLPACRRTGDPHPTYVLVHRGERARASSPGGGGSAPDTRLPASSPRRW